MEKIAENALHAGDTLESLCTRFMLNVSRLVSFISEVNAGLPPSASAATGISPLVLDVIASTVSSRMKNHPDTIASIVSTFLVQTYPFFQAIKDRDVVYIHAHAHEIDQLSPMIIDKIAAFIRSPAIPKESLEAIFKFLDSLVRIAFKREAILLFIGSSSSFPSLNAEAAAKMGARLFF